MYITFYVCAAVQFYIIKNMMMKKIITAAIFFSAITACNEKKSAYGHDDLAEVKQAIAESNRIYFTSFSQNDPAVSTVNKATNK
jgi:hypothetical protein